MLDLEGVARGQFIQFVADLAAQFEDDEVIARVEQCLDLVQLSEQR